MDLTRTAEAKKRTLRASLLRWYRRNARDLPWRRTRDPYRIWLSEIMLQQTRVDTVVPYYERFVQAFPTVNDLAAATLDEVLKLWEGLGYYSRARNLHKASRVIALGSGGRFPATAEELQRLPGIGRYTAGAIASIAFGEAAPALDGNVKRVLARLFAVRDCIDEPKVAGQLWDAATALVSRRSPGNFNQAMMELGARVCTPANPSCVRCPVRSQCGADRLGIAGELPARRARKRVPHYLVVVALIERDGKYLLAQRPRQAMLGGLWELPGGKVEPGESRRTALHRELREKLAVEVEVGPHLATIEHGYSHFSIELHVYRCRLRVGKPTARKHRAVKWISHGKLSHYALPGSTRKALATLRTR